MRISINGSALLATANLGELKAHALQTHADGFDGWWLAQTGLVDALTVFAAIGDSVGGMELGTAVIPTYPRHPTALAGQALTAQAATSARVVLGIGLSHKPAIEGRLEMSFERPVRHMIDYLETLNPLLETGSVDVSGEMFSGHIDAVRPVDQSPSVMVAALGEQMLRVAGRRSDGTILWLVGPRTIEDHIAPHIIAAAEAADRSAPRIVAGLPVAVTDDEADVRELIGQVLASYRDLPSYRAMLDREGVDNVGGVAVVGTEDSVREQLAVIHAAGATELAAVEFGRNPDEQARTRALLQSVNS